MIINYDRIAVMRDGKIAETGTYIELLEQDGILAEYIQANQQMPFILPRVIFCS